MITSKDFEKLHNVARWLNQFNDTELQLIVDKLNKEMDKKPVLEKDRKASGSGILPSKAKTVICPYCGSEHVIRQGTAGGRNTAAGSAAGTFPAVRERSRATAQGPAEGTEDKGGTIDRRQGISEIP
ncbi:MAG: hypothetical protein LKE40_11725 [Spirochaetia bacterium]|jgi:hypothetical protein|nr:hypothetical protein [Spirochaetia bacterium]